MAQIRLACPPPCGHVMVAPDEDALVREVQDHARAVHGHDLTADEVRHLIAEHAHRTA